MEKETKKDFSAPATLLPTIRTITTKGYDHLYIEFGYPLDSGQTNLVREVCLKLQNFGENFIFSYAMLCGIPEQGMSMPLRQSNAGGKVLHVARSQGRRRKPPLQKIRTSILLRLADYISEESLPR